jgi:hypothetical protein
MEKEQPNYESISYAERTRRDPGGRHPVTLLRDSVIIRTDQFPEAIVEASTEDPGADSDDLETIENTEE